ncbi:MAG: hypothetical protein D3926_08115 [Desulfobacteraceae bacterium]|nr:MAG: hypothetical protein D3926_08115 [Desulfobacteraceae bacterium]
MTRHASKLTANALPLLIGSVPMDNHDAATALVFDHTPDIPLWVQLPKYPSEGMVEQFIDGLPGLKREGDKTFIDSTSPEFEGQVLEFFEEYLAVTEAGQDIDQSRFILPEDKCKGVTALLERVGQLPSPPFALKGQVTGPVTFGTGVTDQDERAIFYDDQLRDIMVKRLAMNALWQARHFKTRGAIPIVFIDEPALAGLGTSAYITITRETVTQTIEEIARAIHQEGGYAGVHVCANTEWDLLLEADIDIISFDAYLYFERFILYPEQIRQFLERGGILAWGIVPTLNPEDIRKETVESLLMKFYDQVAQMEDIGIDRAKLLGQCFITPSCGTGPLTLDLAQRVLALTRDLSFVIREDG